MSHVVSQDGTRIAFECAGSGPPLILVDGAFCYRGFGPSVKFVPLLTSHFTVFTWDRRGRGESSDRQPYAVAREVEDLAALIDEAGAPVRLVGFSSGAALALEAAASGLPIEKVVAYEPPYVDEGAASGRIDHEAELHARLAGGDRNGAVGYFMRAMVGAPAAAVVMMRMMPWVWRKLAAVAPTLPYDAAVMTRFEVPRTRLAGVRADTLVVHGSKSDPRLQRAAAAVASAVPGAQQRVLSGQTHNVKASALAPLIVDFCAARAAPAGETTG